MKGYLRGFIFILALFGIDQYTKWLISLKLKPWEIKPVTFYFNLVSVKNTGMVFGFLSGISNKTVFWAITVLSLLAAVFVVYLFFVEKGTFPKMSLALIIAGAAGNLYDRLTKGYVIDFLDFHIAKHHWATFNFADSIITIGSLLLVFYFLMGGEKNVSHSS